jgi:hypothetical protein
MKKLLYIFTFISAIAATASAQLPNGATVPDFTFTDINGVSQNLYNYLNQGKYVALDISTTWCGPCWTYHKSLTMDSLYSIHDLPGDKKWKVLFIEGDGSTDSSDLVGIGGSSQGNWLTGTLFPIVNPPSGTSLNDFLTGFNISFFPTLYVICPNKKVYQDTLNYGNKPTVRTWEYVASRYCGPVGIDDIKDPNPLTIFPNPANDVVTLYFSLNNASTINVSVTNILGTILSTRNYGTLSPGDHALKFDVNQLNPGI